MLEEYEPVNPPEIREVDDVLRLIEFYEPLGIRPELRMFERILGYLGECGPLCVVSLTVDYRNANDDEPSMMVGNLVVTSPIDMG